VSPQNNQGGRLGFIFMDAMAQSIVTSPDGVRDSLRRMEAETYSYCSNGRRILFSLRANVEDERKTEGKLARDENATDEGRSLLCPPIIVAPEKTKRDGGARLTGLFGSGGRFDLKKSTRALLLESFEVFMGERLDCFRSLIGGRETFVVMFVRTYIRRDFQVQWRYN
jgi:hypothetical protein